MKRVTIVVLLATAVTLSASAQSTAHDWYSESNLSRAWAVVGLVQGFQAAATVMVNVGGQRDAGAHLIAMTRRIQAMNVSDIIAEMTIYFSTSDNANQPLSDAFIWAVTYLYAHRKVSTGTSY